MQKPLILVDGSSYLYRAYHALPDLTNNNGEPTGAMYGVINMLKKLLKDYEPSHIAVVFDAKGKNFRHELYPLYKANRPPMPQDLISQIEPLHAIIGAMGIPLISKTGIEADDTIGALVKLAHTNNIKTIISTGDKDIAQLVNDDVTLIDTMKNSTMDTAGVIKKFGLPPDMIVSYLAIVGDASDNIPGIPKAGPKTAVKWLTQYGSLKNLIAHADEISGKIGENLRSNLEQLELSKQLATIKCDLDLELTLEDLTIKPQNTKQLQELFIKWGFKRWLNDLGASQDSLQSNTKTNYQTILTMEDWKTWLAKLNTATAVSFDTETTGLDALRANIVGFSFAIKPSEAIYVPLAHDYLGAPQQLPKDLILADLKTILENKKIKKIGQNLKYDLKVLAKYGITINNIYFDTMLASYVLDSTAKHNMDSLAEHLLNIKTTHYEDITGSGAKQIPFSQVNIDTATNYAAEDADITYQLYEILATKLADDPVSSKIFFEEEMPILEILAAMELDGVKIDCSILNQQNQTIGKLLTQHQHDIFCQTGEEFNLNSPKQLQDILYNKLQLPILKKTPKGQPSTSEEVMQELALTYPLPRLILEYRHLSKLKSTYLEKLPKQVNPKTGRIHTQYHQAITATGRLSSTNPNLQNIPIRTEHGRNIRKAFIAKEGYKILSADYSQVELRIMAHLSKDANLIKAFNNNEDVHKATAAEIFAINKEEVTTDQRRKAKAINFGLMYGMSAFGLAKQLNIPRAEAALYIDVYFDRYPAVAKFMEQIQNEAKTHGYVTTLLGRKLFLPEINSKNIMRKKAAMRAAINAPMQGSAADIIKISMINIKKLLQVADFSANMIMQVHDELVFEVKNGEIDKAKHQIQFVMETAVNLDVPLIVDINTGDNWNQAH